MKILNLYSGIGGNRKAWDGEKHDITAVEKDPEIAGIYRDKFPEDNVIIGDAHEYLKENHEKYDFIWSSPPCPTHSKIRNEAGVGRGQNEPVYPDMKLYEEIIFLQRLDKSKRFDLNYVVENVDPDYEPLIQAQKIQRHLFWSNFKIPDVSLNIGKDSIGNGTLGKLQRHHGFNIREYDMGHKKKLKILKNCTHWKIGKMILEASQRNQNTLDDVL